jgi:hypothetical protein
MKRFAAILLVVAAPAAASDFSALGRPEVVRSVLVPQPRLRELQCAAYARARGLQEHILSAELRDALGAAVSARLAIDVGDAGYAKAMLSDRAQGFADDPTWPFPESRKAGIEGVRANCSVFFAQVAANGVMASLSPAPSRPIELPDAPTCLAAMKDADRRGFDFGQDQGRPYLEQWLFDEPDAAEQQVNRKAVESATSAFERAPLPKEALELMTSFTCMPAFAALAKRFPAPIEADVER